MQTTTEPRIHRWTRDEYYRMAEFGLFQNQRVELINGEIVEMSPLGRPHAIAINLGIVALTKAFGSGYVISPQLPLAISSYSEPEPDISVQKGSLRDSPNDHPSSALLVVEISISTLLFDRGKKASLYASVGIADYWIVNLVDRQLEIYRQPEADTTQPFGFRYGTTTILSATSETAPLALPDARIKVADLLP